MISLSFIHQDGACIAKVRVDMFLLLATQGKQCPWTLNQSPLPTFSSTALVNEDRDLPAPFPLNRSPCHSFAACAILDEFWTVCTGARAPAFLEFFLRLHDLVTRGICRLKHNKQRRESSGCCDSSEKVGVEVQRRRNRWCGELSVVKCRDSHTEISFKCNTGGQPGIADVPLFLHHRPNLRMRLRFTSGTKLS
jgi:hypothetical protein